MNTGISVKCEIAKGMFASEYFDKIKMSDGSKWEGAVDREMVITSSEPNDNFKPARVYAYLVGKDADNALIELPIEDSTSGRRAVVPLENIQPERIPA